MFSIWNSFEEWIELTKSVNDSIVCIGDFFMATLGADHLLPGGGGVAFIIKK